MSATTRLTRRSSGAGRDEVADTALVYVFDIIGVDG
jgi:hypothetical protein